MQEFRVLCWTKAMEVHPDRKAGWSSLLASIKCWHVIFNYTGGNPTWYYNQDWRRRKKKLLIHVLTNMVIVFGYFMVMKGLVAFKYIFSY